MDIKILSEAAVKRVQGNTPEEAEKIMASIRSNLLNLLCRSDEAKAMIVSDLSAYGGRDEVEIAIAKAIANLLALGHVFGADVVGRIIAIMSPEGQNTPASVNPTPTPSTDATSPIPEQADKKTGATAGHTAKLKAGTSKSGDGTENSYKKRFDAAKTDEELKAIWKEIQVSKTLDGDRKRSLYQHMTEVKKKLN